MTNQQFQDVSGFDGFNYLTAGTQPSEKGVAPARRNTLRLWDQKGDPSWMGRFEIEVHDFALQGYNHPEGDFSQNANGFAWSELVTHRPNELVPPPEGVAPTSFVVSATPPGMHWANVFGTLILGIGSSADASLFKETSASNPALAAIIYSPTNEICSLTRVLDDGAERLAVGRVGAAVQLHSDAAATINLTMHSSTNSCWGIIMSGINATDPGVPVMLMYCGTTIGTKATNADLTTAIVTTQTGVRTGGFAIGALKAAGRAQRAYWAIPRATNANGALKFGSEAMMDIWSTDMAGGDMLPVELEYLPDGILGAVPYRHGILAHDGHHVVYWDGDDEYDLNLFRQRVQAGSTSNVIDSDERKRIRGLLVNGPECGVEWQWFDQNATSAGKLYLEMYNYETGSWHNFAPPASLDTTGATPDTVLYGHGGVPLSATTRYTHLYQNANTIFASHFVPRPGESLLWHHSLGGSGSSTTGIPSYDTSCSLLGPRWWLDQAPPGALPGSATIKRNPKVITEVEFGGNLDHGGAGVWSLQVQIFGRGVDGVTAHTAYNQTFSQGQSSAHYRRKNPVQSWANIQDVQVYLTASASGTVRRIPQLLPLTIRGAYIKNVLNAPDTITSDNAGQVLR